MTRAKTVITKRMAQKTDFNITGTGGKVLAETPVITPAPKPIVTPKAVKTKKSKKHG